MKKEKGFKRYGQIMKIDPQNHTWIIQIPKKKKWEQNK